MQMQRSFDSHMQVLVLEGPPRERGRIHGESLRAEIHALMERSSAGASAAEVQSYVEQLTAGAGFLRAAQRWTPELIEELRGIAEGSGLTFEQVFAWQLLDESGWFFKKRHWDDNRCSALGVFGEGQPTLLAQNADMGRLVDGCMKLLHIKEGDFEAYSVTIPGVLGVYSLNNRGVGVCLNAMSGQMGKSAAGLGTIFVSRGIAARESLDAALAFVEAVPHASGENYTIGQAGRVVSVECSAGQVRQFVPAQDAACVYHTNHPLANDDYDDAYVQGLAAESAEARALLDWAFDNTRTRCAALQARLNALPRPVRIEDVRAILSSHDSAEHPICRHERPDRESMTNACIIMELDPAPRMHIAPGPPCMTAFRAFSF